MLGLDMKAVCSLASIGKRTLTEFESGNRAVSVATESKLKAFYISQGISFSTPERAETVGFVALSAATIEPTHEVRDKLEYVDVVGAVEAIEKIESIIQIQKTLDARPKISQLIIMAALKRSLISQKEMAMRLECTPSFVSSVIVGKKAIPSSRSAALQAFFEKEAFDVGKALYQEKALAKISLQLNSLNEASVAAWRAILP